MVVSKSQSQQPVQQVQSTKRADEARLAQQRAEQRKVAESKSAQEPKPGPTVNGQGQTIGTRLSVTA
jgi:hypothetical protein